jgi:carbon-monoxide dehydrogenase catalytic subunit
MNKIKEKKKSNDINERSIDQAALLLLEKAEWEGIETAWDRLEKQLPQCIFGSRGLCCHNCNMGPCRVDPTNENIPNKGVCGATADTIVARNLLRTIAVGASAHSDHGRHMVETLLLASEGITPDFGIIDENKLRSLASLYGIQRDLKVEEMAKRVARAIIAEYGTAEKSIRFVERAPKIRQKIWRDLDISPRGIDREIVEALHRTHIGTDADYVSLLLHGLRTSLGDGWGGSMLATDVSDVLFGTPKPIRSKVNLAVLKEDEVNVVVHGHEPTLSEMIVTAAEDPVLLAAAKKEGAKGINVVGMCCTGNELLMRKGVPIAGNFLNQELALVTGAVEVMVVDIQCIMPAVTSVAECYHTEIITTSPKAKIPGATHIKFVEEKALEIAKEIVGKAVKNFKNRLSGKVKIPDNPTEMVAGFSSEAIIDALGGTLDPLIQAIKEGDIRGIAGVVGCNNPKIKHDYNHVNLTKELIKNNILVVETGCAAIANAKAGLMVPEAVEEAGSGLAKICTSLGIPPVLHMGSCVDCTRILCLTSALAEKMGVDISDLPVAGAAPEWMSEKAVSIGTYFVSSGFFTVLGTVPPVLGSEAVIKLLIEDIEELLGGRFAVEGDPFKAAELIIQHIEGKRENLGI